MPQAASCPSCGAAVVFKSAASIFAVCEYCQSTLVRHDQELEDIGKMAALAEDRSPLQLGAEGVWQGVRFALIGRIQLRYDQGLWNEWHILFDDMRTGWLSEAGGEYALSFLHPVQEPLPTFEQLQVGQRFVMASRPWTVTDIEEAECVAGQGELPFKVGAGYRAPVVDLRNGDQFATLDYSEAPPLLFIGNPVDFKALKLSGLGEGMPIPEVSVQAQVFRCPSCGSPLTARSADILAVGCAACGAVVDAQDRNDKLLSKAMGTRDEKFVPCLPLGSKGSLDGQPLEVIGFLVKETKCDGIVYDWREYLLADDGTENRGTYRWLTEYNGHWNLVDILSRHPNHSGGETPVSHEGTNYLHFATTPSAEVIQVAGEFTWRVKRGETTRVVDYVAPPLMLSRETTGREMTWSRGTYVEPEAIRAAFKLPGDLPEPLGVYANQPNPWEATHRTTCRRFWGFFLIGLLVQAAFLFTAGGQKLLRQDLVFSPQAADETVATAAFEVKGKPQKITVSNSTNLDNNWIGLNLTLVNKNTGAAWPAQRELSYYAGHDEDGSWSEGSREDEVVFQDIPPGTYYLAIDPDLATDRLLPVRDTLEVASGGVGWSNLVILLIFLALFPVFTRLRRGAFEAGRWAESDHAPAADDSDDDSDD